MKNNRKILVFLVLTLLLIAALTGCGQKEEKETMLTKVEKALEEGKKTIPLKELVEISHDKAWLVYPSKDSSAHPEGFKDVAASDHPRIFLQKDGKALEPVEFQGVKFLFPPAVSIPYLDLWENTEFTLGKEGDTPTLELHIEDDC